MLFAYWGGWLYFRQRLTFPLYHLHCYHKRWWWGPNYVWNVVHHQTKTIVLKGEVIGTRPFIVVIVAMWSSALTFQVDLKIIASKAHGNVTMNLIRSYVGQVTSPRYLTYFTFESPIPALLNYKRKLSSQLCDRFFACKFKDFGRNYRWLRLRTNAP